MNSIQLKCFLEVARELNFARAAEHLHFSQPTVSKQIQTLEAELKVKLFKRSTRSVSLTQAGKMFYPNARSIYNQELDAIHNLSSLNMDVDQKIHIGTYGMDLFAYMDKVFQSLLMQYPDIQPDIIFAPYQSLNSSLQSEALDLIIGIKELIMEQSSAAGTYGQLAEAPVSYMVSDEYSDLFADDVQNRSLIDPERFFTLISDNTRINRRVTTPVLEYVLKKHMDLYKTAGSFITENVQYCDNIESAFLQVRAGNAFLILGHPAQLPHSGLCNLPIEDINPFSYGYYYNPANKKKALKLLKQELVRFFGREY